ncbi:MAG: hypothetical protein ACK4HG_02460 [Agrobacterium albertimagni]|uniref:Uncharacterized protein n=1 Tax=Agrobacterium albertimagni TaxID=147266 RepID=A0A7C1T8W3_9HYPH
MDIEDVMKTLAQSCWGRPAIDAELVAMVGELKRDVTAVATLSDGKDGSLFNVEPAAFDRILRAEAKP